MTPGLFFLAVPAGQKCWEGKRDRESFLRQRSAGVILKKQDPTARGAHHQCVAPAHQGGHRLERQVQIA